MDYMATLHKPVDTHTVFTWLNNAPIANSSGSFNLSCYKIHLCSSPVVILSFR